MANPQLSAAFLAGLVERATQARAWDVVAAVIEKPEGAGIVVAKRGAIDQALRELDAERAMISGIQELLGQPSD